MKFLVTLVFIFFTNLSYGFSLFNDGFVDTNENFRFKVFKAPVTPAPTILISHGSDGAYGDSYRLWAKEINSWGYNAVIVDSYTKRGFSELPNQGWKIPMIDRAKDFVQVSDILVNADWHNGNFGFIGFSQGGATGLSLVKYLDQTKIKAAVLFYPSCFYESPASKPKIPTQLHLGMKDDWAKPEYCGRDLDNYQVFKHENASHAFDIQRGYRVTKLGFHLWYDSQAHELSKQTAKKMFDDLVK